MTSITKADLHLISFQQLRDKTLNMVSQLTEADANAQPIIDVSPPKWHLAHTTWFFERFILMEYLPNYSVFNNDFHFLFNSYYESEGERVPRDQRGFQTRPELKDVIAFRNHVDRGMIALFQETETINERLNYLIELGLQHEQQHQELLWTDIKYILGKQALSPIYASDNPDRKLGMEGDSRWIEKPEGIYHIGFEGEDFSFDNELGRHRVFLEPYSISSALVTNAEYLEFIEDGGYQNFRFWLSEAWAWLKETGIESPEYWKKEGSEWMRYSLDGWQKPNPNAPVSHISYYEADAFASWKGQRLATEQEWEAASDDFEHGKLWEWTASAYLPYPGFTKELGAIGEYNGKFMINQMVLRGSSVATAAGHSRKSYRNFFPPDKRWQFSGIRLCKSNI